MADIAEEKEEVGKTDVFLSIEKKSNRWVRKSILNRIAMMGVIYTPILYHRFSTFLTPGTRAHYRPAQ